MERDNVFGGVLRDQVKDLFEYYFNIDRFTTEPLPSTTETFIEETDRYYHYVPIKSIQLIQGERDLKFAVDKGNLGQITSLLARIKDARTHMTDPDEVKALDNLVKDATRLQRLMTTLPSSTTSANTDTYQCTYRLDRFFHGLDQITFIDKTQNVERQKRAGTRHTNSNNFHPKFVPIESKYASCLIQGKLNFEKMDKLSTSSRTICTARHWLKLTEVTTALMRTSPPATPEEDIIAYNHIRNIIYSMPIIHDIFSFFKDNILSSYSQVTRPTTMITDTDYAVLETQLILIVLPILTEFEAMYFVRSRRGQIDNKWEMLKILLYLSHLKTVQTTFPSVHWEDYLFNCDLIAQIPEDNRQQFLQENPLLDLEVSDYKNLCCTNRHGYTCPSSTTFQKYIADTNTVKGSILFSWIPAQREQQINTPYTSTWPELLKRTEELKKITSFLFTSTPFKKSTRTQLPDITDIAPDYISLSTNKDTSSDSYGNKEHDILAGNFVLPNDIPFPDSQTDIDTNTPSTTQTTEQPDNITEQNVQKELDRTPRDNTDDEDIEENVNNEDKVKRKLDFDSIASECYGLFYGQKQYDQTCARLFHYDATVERTKINKRNQVQDLQLFSNIILDTITQVNHYSLNAHSIIANPSIELLATLCEDISNVKLVLQKPFKHNSLSVYLMMTDSTIYLPAPFCSEYYCHTLISDVIYVRTTRDMHCHNARRINDDQYICETTESTQFPECYAVLGPNSKCRFTQTPNTRISSAYHLLNDNTAILAPSANVIRVNNEQVEKRISNVLVQSQRAQDCARKLENSHFFMEDLEIIRLFDRPNDLKSHIGKLSWLAGNLNLIGWISLTIGIALFGIGVSCAYCKIYRYCKYRRVETDDIELESNPNRNCSIENNDLHDQPVLILKKKKKRSRQ